MKFKLETGGIEVYSETFRYENRLCIQAEPCVFHLVSETPIMSATLGANVHLSRISLRPSSRTVKSQAFSHEPLY